MEEEVSCWLLNFAFIDQFTNYLQQVWFVSVREIVSNRFDANHISKWCIAWKNSPFYFFHLVIQNRSTATINLHQQLQMRSPKDFRCQSIYKILKNQYYSRAKYSLPTINHFIYIVIIIVIIMTLPLFIRNSCWQYSQNLMMQFSPPSLMIVNIY